MTINHNMSAIYSARQESITGTALAKNMENTGQLNTST